MTSMNGFVISPALFVPYTCPKVSSDVNLVTHSLMDAPLRRCHLSSAVLVFQGIFPTEYSRAPFAIDSQLTARVQAIDFFVPSLQPNY